MYLPTAHINDVLPSYSQEDAQVTAAVTCAPSFSNIPHRHEIVQLRLECELSNYLENNHTTYNFIQVYLFVVGFYFALTPRSIRDSSQTA